MRMRKAEMEVIRFTEEDVIATSGGDPITPQFLTLSKFDDLNPNDNKFSYI